MEGYGYGTGVSGAPDGPPTSPRGDPPAGFPRGFLLGAAMALMAGLILVSGPRVALAENDSEGCLDCHAYAMTTTFQGEEVDLRIDQASLEASPHKDVPCSLCHTENHGPLDQVRAAAYQACANCHPGHEAGQAGVFTHPDPPLTCESCHGPVHAVVPASDPTSPLSKASNVEFCGGCHSEELAAYNYSYHGAAHTLGSKTAPVCADCHGHVSPVSPLPAGESGEQAMKETISTCETCHRGGAAAMAALVASGPEHVTPLDRGAGIDGTARWVVWKFFLLLILFNVTKDGAVLALDLTRRLRKRGNGGGGKSGRDDGNSGKGGQA